MHYHQCGCTSWSFTDDKSQRYIGPQPGVGCGHVYSHGEENKGNLDAHKCEVCGRQDVHRIKLTLEEIQEVAANEYP